MYEELSVEPDTDNGDGRSLLRLVRTFHDRSPDGDMGLKHHPGAVVVHRVLSGDPAVYTAGEWRVTCQNGTNRVQILR